MSFTDLWDKFRGAPSFVPAIITIPIAHTDKRELLTPSFKADEHYFTVRVNEMFLTYKRKWFSTYDPVVLSVTEFNYDGEKKTVPFVVGPSLIKNMPGAAEVPEGMVFRDTTIAGTHPFKGGTFTTSIILCSMVNENYLRRILKILEQTANTYTGGFSTMVNPYMKVANIILDGIDQLFKSNDIKPIIGYRKELSQNATDDFKPGYYAIINKDAQITDPTKFFVRDGMLLYGDNIQKAVPYREDDYVMYSIMAGEQRDDVQFLPVFKEWKELRSYAMLLPEIKKEDWSHIKARLFGVANSLWTSPDLTTKQAGKLSTAYTNEIVEIKKSKEYLYGGGGTEVAVKSTEPDMSPAERQLMNILNL